MKIKYILFACLLAQLSFADNLKNIMHSYNNKDYALSYDLANAYLKKHPASLQANLFFADSAYKLALYHDAIAAYDRALILDSNNIHAKFGMAYVHLATNNLQFLRMQIEELYSFKLSSSQKEALEFLSSKVQSPLKYYGAFGVGAIFDNNVNQNIGGRLIYIPTIQSKVPSEGKEKGYAHFESLYFGVTRKLSNPQNKIFADILAYNKGYFDDKFSKNDLGFLSFSTGFRKDWNSFSVVFPMRFEQIFLDHKAYQSSFVLGVDSSYYKDAFVFELGLNGKINHHNKEEDDKKDSSEINAYAGLTQYFDHAYVGSKFNFSKVIAKNEGRNDVSYNEYSLDIYYLYKFNKWLSAKAGVEFAWNDYTVEDSQLFLSKRHDDLIKGSLSLEYEINKSNIITLGTQYTKRDSNHEVYSYKKMTTSLHYSYLF